MDLSGVPSTLLWNLGRRAAAARAGALNDPVAIEVLERLRYDFPDLSGGARWHAVRVTTFDAAVRRFLSSCPTATVVALGEGLETQFWRVDNGNMRWLTVDLPVVLELRHRVLPEGPRQRSHAGSALDLTWIDELDPSQPVMITAQGLLMYFHRDEVHRLIASVAERLPGSTLVFDVVPENMRELVRRAPGREGEQAAQLWSWLFNRTERAALLDIGGVAALRDLAPPVDHRLVPLALVVVRRLPRRVRYALPVFPILQIGFR